MANPYHHALSSVRKWGGEVGDYLPLHEWLDESKGYMGDFRHRALRHHAQGIFEMAEVFGPLLTLSTGKVIPTRWVGEQHVIEDLGRIPTIQDWFQHIVPQPWMNKPRKLSVELEQSDHQPQEAENVAAAQCCPEPRTGSGQPAD